MERLSLEQALEEAPEVRWALTEASHKLTGKCWMTVNVYPHSGCAEFSGPDTFMCDNPGQWWALEDPAGYADMSAEWWLVCDEHKTPAAAVLRA